MMYGRCERIRTSDPFVPNEVRYQAAPHTVNCAESYYTRGFGLVNPSPFGQ